MKHLIGLMKPDSGQILMNGEDICRMDDAALLKLRTRFGMVFQQAALFDSMTVWENVAFPLLEHTRLSRSEVDKRVLEKLAIVGLESSVDKFPQNYRAVCVSASAWPGPWF